MLCRLKSCVWCNGDMIIEEDIWKCFQCGRFDYLAASAVDVQAREPGPPISRAADRVTRKKRYEVRSDRNMNLVIRAHRNSEERWWARNQDIIFYLTEGRSTREIAAISNRGERQIRVIRERLADLRNAAV